jgi:hypothetical protein
MYKRNFCLKIDNLNMNNIKTQNNFSPYLFTKKINTNYKLVPFNISTNDVGKTKYLPAVSKE